MSGGGVLVFDAVEVFECNGCGQIEVIVTDGAIFFVQILLHITVVVVKVFGLRR
jgi:hypothetical protein